MQDIEKFFKPKSVAVIGASRNSKKLGAQILKNIIKSGFKGKIYPINPQTKKIQGLVCYPSVLEVSGKIDLAVVVIPKNIVPLVLEGIGKKGIKSVIIITAGFGETGKEGRKLEVELRNIAEKYNLRIIGPNCLGIIDTRVPINCSFADTFPLKKNLAVVSQSGAMCAAILDWAEKNNIGFSRFVSLGNKIDVDETDIFEVLRKDKNSKVVLGYIEGIKRGQDFIEKASKLTQKKPLIAIKSGSSKAGSRAASSHTGALTGREEATNAAFRKAGIIRVFNIEELFDFSEAFSTLPFPKDNKVAVLANAGGPAVLTVDAISNSFLHLAEFSQKTGKLLKSKLPEETNIRNPVDVVGDAPAKRYQDALKIILADSNVSSVIVLLTPQTSTEIEKTAEVIAKFKKTFTKPIVASFIGGDEVEKGVRILEKNGIPNFEFPERAVKALSELYFYKNFKKSVKPIEKERLSKRNKVVEKILQHAKWENRKNLNDLETKKIMQSIGINVSNSKFVKTAKEAMRAAKKIGYPVVLKIVSSDILHKTEHGLVRINLSNQEEVEKAFSEIKKNAKKLGLNFSGLMVYKMVEKGTELIVGAKRDSVFGPVVMFGLGGIYIQILKDTTFSIAPVSEREVHNMVEGIRGKRLLTGFRGRKAVSIKKVKEVILKISDLVMTFPEISELDINPLIADSKTATALDIKIVLEGK